MISEEQAERLWKAIGALEAGLIAMERAKTDRIESGALLSKFDSLEKDKADRIDLLRLRDAIMKDLHETVEDLSERIGDRFNSTGSQILGLRDRLAGLAERLEKMADKDDARGAEIARLGDALADLAKALHEKAKAEAAEKAGRWRKFWRWFHLFLQYTFQTVAGLTILIIFIQQGVTGLPEALSLFKAAFGAP